jgi:hypothetical protein
MVPHVCRTALTACNRAATTLHSASESCSVRSYRDMRVEPEVNTRSSGSYATTRSGKARMMAAVRFETSSLA